MLDLRLCIKSLISSGVVGAMMKISEFGFFKKSVKIFLVGGIFYWRFAPINVKKLLKFSAISIGSVIVLSTFCFLWKIWFNVYLGTLFWNLFYSAQNNANSKFVYFTLLVQLFYSFFFCMNHAWSISVAYFLLLSSAYKVYPFSSMMF